MISRDNDIRILSDKEINLIAAGEVIERPSSVLKELIENSIDAGATSISVAIECGGKTSLVVKDNGGGICEKNMLLTLKRNATSKLLNIFDIRYFGFRGEALASIASISHFKITSRHKNSSLTWSITTEDNVEIKKTSENNNNDNNNYCSNHDKDELVRLLQDELQCKIKLQQSSREIGTTIEVRNLFYKTPNRLRFLKTKQYEAASCINIFQKLAIIHHDIDFVFYIDGVQFIRYFKRNNMTDRVHDVLGRKFSQQAIAFDKKFIIDGVDIRVYGNACIPQSNGLCKNGLYKKNFNENVFCFVNGRSVHDNIMKKSIAIAYHRAFDSPTHPSCVLCIDINSQYVDVNVHPMKLKVRFANENVVRNAIIDAILSVIKNIIPNVDHDVEDDNYNVKHDNNNVVCDNNYSNKFTRTTIVNETNKIDKIYDWIQSSNVEYIEMEDPMKYQIDYKHNTYIQKNINELRNKTDEYKDNENPVNFCKNKNLDKKETNNMFGVPLCQIGLRYILSYVHDGIFILDQHAAHERIILEKMKMEIKQSKSTNKTFVIPMSISLMRDEVIQLLSIVDVLSSVGIQIEKNNNDSIFINQWPSFFDTNNVAQTLKKILFHIKDIDIINITQCKIINILSDVACKQSIKSGQSLSLSEMDALLRQLESCDFGNYCNHGRPTHIKLSTKYLDKLFKR